MEPDDQDLEDYAARFADPEHWDDPDPNWCPDCGEPADVCRARGGCEPEPDEGGDE